MQVQTPPGPTAPLVEQSCSLPHSSLLKSARIEQRLIVVLEYVFSLGHKDCNNYSRYPNRPVDQGERPGRGRGGGRGRGMRGGGNIRSTDGFDQRGKREFERHSGSDRT